MKCTVIRKSLGVSDMALEVWMSEVNPIRFLRLPEVKRVTGIGRSSIYLLIQQKKFPDPIHLQQPSVSVWRSDEVQKWITEKIESASATVSG